MPLLMDEKQHDVSESDKHHHLQQSHTRQSSWRRQTICSRLTSVFNRIVEREPQPLYLPLSDDSIRLLHIEPSRESEELHCGLHVVRLSHNPPIYEALSYTWASPEDKHIVINKRYPVTVTRNLFYALQQLRKPDQRRVIWVDALCINQRDDQEKSTQIRKMDMIYKSAGCVVVWLGRDESGEAKRAFDIIRQLVEASNRVNDDASLEPSITCTISSAPSSPSSSLIQHLTTTSTTTSATALPIPISDSDWSTVQSLFAHRWFVRLWVIQELVLARSAIFHWGNHKIPWNILGSAVSLIRFNVQLAALLESQELQNAYLMYYLHTKGIAEAGSSHPFVHLLDWSRNFDVSEKKDKIYALLGLVSPPTLNQAKLKPKRKCGLLKSQKTRPFPTPAPFIEPDYSENTPVEELYTQTTLKIISQDANLDVLSFVSHEPDSLDTNSTLPTWVPDFASRTTISPLSGQGTSNTYTAGTFKPLSLSISHHSSPSTTIALRGVRVDVVNTVLPGTPYTLLKNSSENLETLLTNVMASFSESLTIETIATTLSAGRTSAGFLFSSPEEREQYFADLVALLESFPNIQTQTLIPGLEQQKNRTGGCKERVKEALWRFNCCRSVFGTRDGRMGLGPAAMKEGDVVVVLWGGQGVYVLRRVGGCENEEEKGEEQGLWVFIGECFIQGFMDGKEVKKMIDDEKVVEEAFELH